MGSKIQWTDETWNPTTGCTRVSSGCDHCYAVTMTKRLAAMGVPKYRGLLGKGHFNGVVKTWDDELAKPLRWKKPRMVFVNSMSDLFHKDVPFEFIDKVFAVMAICPQHVFQVLTKRAERMSRYCNGKRHLWGQACTQREAINVALREIGIEDLEGYHVGRAATSQASQALMSEGGHPLPNVWIGTSVENQEVADERIPHLLRCPSVVRFLSCEPLLGSIDLATTCINPPQEVMGLGGPYHYPGDAGVGWVIVGCESRGNKVGRLPNSSEQGFWNAAERIVQQCKDAGVACFVKQGPRDGRVVHELEQFPPSCRVREWPQIEHVMR